MLCSLGGQTSTVTFGVDSGAEVTWSSPDTASDVKKAMRDCTRKPLEYMGDKNRRNLLETRLRKRRMHQCRTTFGQLQHWLTPHTMLHLTKINRTCGIRNGTVATHPQSTWNVRDGLHTEAVTEVTSGFEMTGITPPSDAGPAVYDTSVKLRCRCEPTRRQTR